MQKNASGGLITYLANFGLILYSNFLKKFTNNWFWTCVFQYINITYKKLKYKNQAKDRIKPPLVLFSAFLKKTTKSRANPLNPDSNGQGF
jgi:hypothetical protein